MKHIIRIMEEISHYTFRSTFETINGILEKGKFEDDIYILINSSGGDIDSTFAIIDFLESLPNEVYTINIGKAESCAASIFIHGKKRYMAKHAKFTFHSPAYISQKDMNFPTISLEKKTQELKHISEGLEDFLKTQTNIPLELIKEGINSPEGITFYAEDCIGYNIADEIITDISKILY